RVLPSVTAAAPGRPDRRTAPQRLPCLAMLGSERGPRRALVGAVLAMTVALAACGGDDDEPGADAPGREADDTTTTTEAATEAENVSWVAQARDDVSQIDVFDEPGAASPIHQLANPKRVDDQGNSAPLVFLVKGTDVSGEWLPVYLPVPPNGSSGYVRAADVELFTHDYRITVELGAHRLTLTEAGETVLETTVGLGRAGRETPAGVYYITELLQAPDPSGPYGPYAYGISGFQDDE